MGKKQGAAGAEALLIVNARRMRWRLLTGTALVAVSLAMVAAPRSVSAQTWDGQTNTLWGVGTNWVGDVVPAAGGAVVVDGAGGANQPTLNVVSTVDTVVVSSGALTVDNVLTATTGVTVSGTGTIIINNATGSVVGSMELLGGTLDNNGTINGQLTVSGGQMNNAGAVLGATEVSGGLLSLIAGTNLADDQTLLVSGGTVDVAASDTIGKLTTSGGKIDIAAGKTLTATTINHDGGTINVGAGATLQGTGNTLNNGATINVATNGVVTDAGAINNLAAGVINFNGPGGLATLNSDTNVISNAGQINVLSGDVDVTGIVTNSGSGLLSLGAKAGVVTAGIVLNTGTAQIDIKGGTLDTALLTNLSTNAAGVNIGANGALTATAVINKAGATIVNAGLLSSDVPVINGGVITNSGILDGGIVNTGKVGNTGTINGGVTNTGGTFTTSGIVTGGLINAGTTNASGKISGNITNVAIVGVFNTTGNLAANGKFDNQAGAKLNVNAGTFNGITTLTNSGTITIAAKSNLSAATINNNKGATINIGAAAGLYGTGNTLNNNATINVAANGVINDAGNVNNNATGVINFNGASGTAYIISGAKVIANAGAINVIAAGNVQINGDVTNSGKASLLMKAASGDVAVIGNFANNGTSTINVQGGQLTITKTLTNASTAGAGVNIASGAGINAQNITNNAGSKIVNAGTLASANKIQNDGSLTNKVGGVINGGVVTTAFVQNDGTLNGGVDNAAGATVVTTGVINQGATNAGSFLASGAVNGPIVNNGAGTFIVSGALAGNSTFTNNDTAQLLVTGGNFTGLTTLTNNSTNAAGVLVAGGQTLSAVNVVNAAGSKIVNSGTLTSANPISNSGEIINPGTINGGVANLAGGVVGTFGELNGGITNAGTVNARGVVTGAVVNDNIFNVINPLTGNNASTFTNNATGQLNVTGGNYTGLTTLTNTGTVTIADGKTLEAGVINNNGGSIAVGAGSTLKGTANTLNNAATINVATDGKVIDAGNFNNLATGVINFNGPGGTATLQSGTNVINNAGKINVTSGALNVTGNVTNSGAGLFSVTSLAPHFVTGNVLNTGTSQVDIQIGQLVITGSLTNQSSNAAGVNTAAGTLLVANAVSNAVGATIVNAGTLVSVTPILNAGTLNSTGTMANGLTNTATGVVKAAGEVNGVIVNNGLFTVTGALKGDNTFTNQGAGSLRVTGGDFTGITTLTNLGGTVNVSAGRTLSTTTAIANNAGTFTSLGTVTSPTITNSGAMNLEGTLNAATSFTNANLVNLTGNLGGTLPVINNQAAGNIVLNGFTLNNGAGTLTNAGKITALGTTNQITGNVINNNLISLRDGVNTNDALVIGGKLGGSGTLAVDANLASPSGAGRGDLLTVNGSSAGANVNVAINPTGTGAALSAPINVYNAAGGGAPNVTVNGASRINPFLQSGLVNYFLAESAPGSGLFQIQSTVNTGAAMGIASGLSGAMGALQSGFHQPVSAIVSKPENCGPDQLVGGMFIRVTGGSTDTTLNGSGALTDGTNGATARTSSSARFGGFQTGFDMGKCNVGNSGWDMHFGIMTGMVDVNMSSRTAVTNNNGLLAQGAATSLEIAVPFLGAYAFARNSGFTFEANLRRDFYRVGISSIAGNVYVPRFTKINGEGTSFNAQISYRVMLGDRFFVEPQAGYSYGVSSFGALNLFTGPLGAQTAVASVAFDDTKSSLGRVGFLAGTTLQITDKLYGAPFVQALLWREFGDPTNARTTLIANPALNPPQVFASQTERVGTFGQVGGGLQLRLLDSPWSGFVRGDYRFGDKIDGVALNVGVRGNFSTY